MSAPDLAALARPVRHEANNLLAALGGTLELMRRAATEDRALERIARMTEATARLEALFKAYLALAAPAAPDPDGTDAPRVLAQLQPLLVLLLGPGRPLEIEAPPRLRRIAMPPEELQPLVLDLARRAAARVEPPGRPAGWRCARSRCLPRRAPRRRRSGCPARPDPQASTRRATTSSFASRSGSRFSGAVISA